jgi:transglutaminase-like putative cysteine protease
MRFFVRHETVYRYSVPVQLAPHILRLTPRREGTRTLSHALTLQPQPSARIDRDDAFGNIVTELGFLGSTQPLAALPWAANANDGLERYRQNPNLDLSVQRFASDLAAHADYAPLTFLDQLTRTLFTRTDQQLRPAGAAQPAAATLASWQGACRDLTVLFVAACRCVGIASRFTSGYLAPLDGTDAQRQLHAWPEVFLPGIGWRGWDPSQGQRVMDAHVPLCAAPTQSAAMPVEGGYFFTGDVVTTTLDYTLQISINRSG